MKKIFYVTTPIYYPSGSPHLGHAYTSIACDVLVRWNKNIGNKTFFTTGNDDHGQKIVEEASKAKLSYDKFTDKYAKEFKDLFDKLDIKYDYYVRTKDEKHEKFVQNMLQKSFDNNDIYKGEYEGLYCVGCEKYYTQKDSVEGFCPTHKTELRNLKEETYFFKLSKYQDKLLDFYKKNSEFLSPKSKSKEILNRVEEGLRDISISRHKNSLEWGIELPFDKTHVTYVWFDALFNYLSSCEINKDKREFWPCSVHVVGSDITWFHTVYWPAFLMSVGYELPKKVFSHGMVLDKQGHKMSKSLANVIDPIMMKDKYGSDEFRYYLMSAGTFGEDLNISEDELVQKINNELNNDFGNLVSRVHTMTSKYFEGIVPEQGELEKSEIKLITSLNVFEDFNKHMQKLEFNKALELLWSRIRKTNAYINEVQPWKEEDKKRLASIINTLIFAVKKFGDYIDCFMPQKAELLRKQFNFIKKNFEKTEDVKVGHKLGDKINLFEKIKLEEVGWKSVKQKIFIENKRNKKMYCELFSQKNDKLIIFVHSFTSNRLGCDSEMLKDNFLEKGYDFFRFDFCGAGKSDFDTITIAKELEDLNLVLEEINKRYKYKYKILFGSSLGGLLSLQANHTGISKLILNAPVTIPITKEKYFKRKLFSKRQLDEMEKTGIMNIENSRGKFVVEEKIFHEREKLDTKKLLEKLEIPIFILQGDEDKVVLLEDTLDCYKYNNKIKIEIIKGGTHSLNQNSKQAKKEWLKKFFNFLDYEKITFSSLNLRVGKIISIEQHPDAEKLYLEKIDVGEEEPRTIISGLKDYYTLEEMKNKKVIVVCNLKAAKLRGIESEGMVLAVESKDGQVGLLTSDAKVGNQLSCNGEIANNSSIIQIDDFFKIKIKSIKGKVIFNGEKLEVRKGKITVDKKLEGKIR